jgi:V8-like Glu-specific endopeptidase
MTGDVPSRMDPPIAKLVKVVDGKIEGYCTVFKVGTDLAMTAGHCCGANEDDIDIILKELGVVTPKKVISYYAEGPHAVPGAGFEVLSDDDEHDVCVMRGKMTGAPLALAMHDPDLGARVWTAGYPKTYLLFSDGLWSGRHETEDYGKASVAVWGGASGSPVLDGDGRVVGVLVAMYPPMSNFSLIAPIEWLRAGMQVARLASK